MLLKELANFKIIMNLWKSCRCRRRWLW